MFEGMHWNGDSLVIIDNYADQVVSLGSLGAIGSSVELPGWVRPAWRDRRRMFAYGAFRVLGITESGAFVGTALTPHRYLVYGPANKPDSSQSMVLRVSRNGIIERVIATLNKGKAVDRVFGLPDGRVVILRPTRDGMRMFAVGPGGDTLFDHPLETAGASASAPRIIVGGPDGSIWMSTATGSPVRHYQGFDKSGVPFGALTLPAGLQLEAGDRDHLLVSDIRGRYKRISRYTLRRLSTERSDAPRALFPSGP